MSEQVNIDFAIARSGISFGGSSQNDQASAASTLGQNITELASSGMAGAVQGAALTTNELTGDQHKQLLSWGQQALVDNPTTAVNILLAGQDGAQQTLLNSGTSHISQVIGNQV
jgi:hypothetical protein